MRRSTGGRIRGEFIAQIIVFAIIAGVAVIAYIVSHH
jgi:hypothetical protein